VVELAVFAQRLNEDENPSAWTREILGLPPVARRHRRRFPTYLLVDDRSVVENLRGWHLGRLGRKVLSWRHAIFDWVRNTSDVESFL